MPKSKKNAFSFFLESYCNEQQLKGRHITKWAAAEECGPLWTALPKKEKEIYRAMARREKEESMTSTSFEWENPAEQALREEEAAIKYLESTVKDENDTRNHLFYTIHVNYFCKTYKNKYIPGEFALCEFNLQDGVMRKLNIMINPGKVPLGLAYQATRFINKVHGLPYPEEDTASNLTQISKQILEFMQPTKDEKDNYPPLFAVRLNVDASKSIINDLVPPSKSELEFKVYKVEILLYWLNRKCATYGINEGYSFKAQAEYDMDRDLFGTSNTICCSFHEDLDGHFYGCSLSHVQRSVFTICDICCPILSIPLVHGCHKLKRPSYEERVREMSCDESSTDEYLYREDPEEHEACEDHKERKVCEDLKELEVYEDPEDRELYGGRDPVEADPQPSDVKPEPVPVAESSEVATEDP